MSLQGKDQFQVFTFVPVIQEAVIEDLLKASRKHMHQIPADEFRIVQSDRPAWFSGALPRAENVTFLSSTDRIRLFEMATL